jgi:hypothetical protein
MISWLAAFGAVVLAAAIALPSGATGASRDVRIDVVSVSPRPPRAAEQFELVAEVQFAPAPGSLRAVVWIGERRFRNMRLAWKDPIARCSFVVPSGSRGKRLTIGLTATLGASRARTGFTFTVT